MRGDQSLVGTPDLPLTPPGWEEAFNWTARSCLPCKVRAAGRGSRSNNTSFLTSGEPNLGGGASPFGAGPASGLAQVPAHLRVAGIVELRASQVQGRWSASPLPSAPHPDSSPGPAQRGSEGTSYHHGIRKLVVQDGK